MKIGEIKVISSKENSSMASIWTTFLCLERLSEDEYQVCIRAYEILCTADDIVDCEELVGVILRRESD